MSHIAFIGLGMMGFPMAHLLHTAGHRLSVRDASQDVVDRFLAEHSDASITDNASLADVETVITMLPNSDIVEQVLQEIAPFLKPGAMILDMSSSDPIRTRKLAGNLAERGLRLNDAPVSGGVKKAVNGSLAIMFGGEPAEFEKQRPILDTLGQTVAHVGTVGAGHALKALNNYVSAAAMIATAEAIHVGASFGIDPATVVDVINASTGKNNTTENKARQFMLNGAFNSGFSLALQAKDVGIAASLGEKLAVSMPLSAKVCEITEQASKTLGPKADHTELYKYLALKK